MNDETITQLASTRRAIAELIASELGLRDLDTLTTADRTVVERQTDETIEGCGDDATEPADCSEANIKLRRLLSEYHALKQLRADSANVILAEQGEVFSQDDDA